MAAKPGLTEAVDRLIELFNHRSLDLPDGFFTRHTQFRLNGVAFEEMLGRPPGDPLVLMLARGPAGYRFTAKAIQHAIPDARLQRGELTETRSHDRLEVTGQCWLSGAFRGTSEPADLLVTIVLTLRGASVERAEASLDPGSLERIREARLRP